jgi:hypothetical protein
MVKNKNTLQCHILETLSCVEGEFQTDNAVGASAVSDIKRGKLIDLRRTHALQMG